MSTYISYCKLPAQLVDKASLGFLFPLLYVPVLMDVLWDLRKTLLHRFFLLLLQNKAQRSSGHSSIGKQFMIYQLIKPTSTSMLKAYSTRLSGSEVMFLFNTQI